MTTLLKALGAAALLVFAATGVYQERHLATSATPAPAVATAPAPADQAGAPATKIRLVKDPKPVPAFSVTAFDGRTLTAAALRGKVVVLNFWATWCGPCRAEIPDLIALQKKYGDQVVVVGLSEDETGEAGVRKFVGEHQMTYPVGMASAAIDKMFGGISSLPTTFMIDRDGLVVAKHKGFTSAATTELEIRALLDLPVNATIERYDDEGETTLGTGGDATKIPGVDLTKLTPTQRLAALQRLNKDQCSCGCARTLASCRIEDPSCETSLPLAKKLVEDITKTIK